MIRLLTLSLALSMLLNAPSSLGIQLHQLPDPLKPWATWALGENSQLSCPFAYQDYPHKQCNWPGRLTLNLEAQGGRFDQEWTLFQDDVILLPGDPQYWPQQVSINQQTAVVMEYGGRPAIRMPAGQYKISGRFFWDNLPESLAIAENTGLIHLEINGRAINQPRIEHDAIWLSPQQVTENGKQQNSLDIQVFRQIVDDIPLRVITRLELDVSGTPREISLPTALLPGFIPLNLDSPLPARLETDGRLSLQIRPGHWSLELIARHPALLEKLELPASRDIWPTTELWAFQAQPALRLVEIHGLTAIDGSQTNLPEQWRNLPTYQVAGGQVMIFKTLRRGDPEPEPNQLNVSRQLWLDFNGAGYTVSDSISGKMSRDWRLNATPELQVGQVLLNGENQLITQQANQTLGFELRRGRLQVQADSRIENDIGTLNAVGWQQSFQHASAVLNIPPGWRLLAVSGVDNDPDCWLSRWSLLDIFLVLIIALAVGRLWSWPWAAFALLTLTLSWHETDSPQWVWLNLLAALALLQVLPEGRLIQLARWYRNLCWLALIAIAIPFMVTQLRSAIYPQLDHPASAFQPSLPEPAAAQDFELYSKQSDNAVSMLETQRLRSAAPASAVLKKPLSPKPAELDRIDPNANLQTGPGLPKWQWRRVTLNWNGVVDPQQPLRLWYLSPRLNSLLKLLEVLLTITLALRMFGLFSNGWPLKQSKLAALIALPLFLLPTTDSHADFPDQALLREMATRLQAAPDCLPTCAQLASIDVDAGRDTLQVELEFHAQQAVFLPLPVALKHWYPAQIEVDGRTTASLTRQDDDMLWLMLTQGVHKVVIRGGYGNRQKFTLPFPVPPHYTRVKADGWLVDGLYENGRTGPQLEFTRSDVETKNQPMQTALPAFVSVERTLQLGLDWRVITRVSKQGDNASSLLQLPLLPGEAVTSAGVRVLDGKVLVNMAANQSELEWQSTLEKSNHLQLTASDSDQWREIWRADVSPTWHLQSSGIPVIQHQDAQGTWLPEWRPWPGERVELTISRPAAASGATVTIDKSMLQLWPGKRNQQLELDLDLRSSKGGQHSIELPSGAVLQSVNIDGNSQPLRQQQGTVIVPIHPGSQHIALRWQTATPQSSILTTPNVNLGVASVNSHVQIHLGEDRWLLWTWGPQFGPAALIWGMLIVLALLAIGLDRLRLTPLRHWQWFLLFVGLSQLHIAGAMLVTGWLLALDWRSRLTTQQAAWFNLMQVGLGLLSVCAILLLFTAVQQGLLGSPDMQIAGNESDAFHLKWYQDHANPQLPSASIVCAPLMLYRILMLSWALWMALSLLDWLRWGWYCFASNGYWRQSVKGNAPPSPT